ncbi:MAG: hypothetical protein ACFFBD_20410 [Candidatus Hodarchaeota archaeon]
MNGIRKSNQPSPFPQIEQVIKIGKHFFSPLPQIPDSFDKRRAQFLSIVTLFFIPSTSLLFIVDLLISFPQFSAARLFILLYDALFLFLTVAIYLLSRTKWFELGTLVLLCTLYFTAYFFLLGQSPVISPTSSHDYGLIGLVISIFLSAILMSRPRYSFLVSLLGLGGFIIIELLTLTFNFNIIYLKSVPILLTILLTTLYSSVIHHDRQEIIKTSQQYLDEKKKIELMKLEEERYHTMLGHFLQNDMQKIVLAIELLTINPEQQEKEEALALRRILDIAFESTKKIRRINKIFEVLNSSKDLLATYNLSRVIQDVLLKLNNQLKQSIVVNFDKNLNIDLLADSYLEEMFLELITFTCSFGGQVEIKAFRTPSEYYVSIKENCLSSIPDDVCQNLEGKITENWEAQGLYSGISLASVIIQSYGGKLRIRPGDKVGNEFHLVFPLEMVLVT